MYLCLCMYVYCRVYAFYLYGKVVHLTIDWFLLCFIVFPFLFFIGNAFFASSFRTHTNNLSWNCGDVTIYRTDWTEMVWYFQQILLESTWKYIECKNDAAFAECRSSNWKRKKMIWLRLRSAQVLFLHKSFILLSLIMVEHTDTPLTVSKPIPHMHEYNSLFQSPFPC